MTATYTKLRDGSWGIRVRGEARQGQTVTVTKRDATQQTETVARVLWTGPDRETGETVSVCSIAKQERPAGGASKRTGHVCAECGKPGRLVHDLEDGLPKHFNCCDIPPG